MQFTGSKKLFLFSASAIFLASSVYVSTTTAQGAQGEAAPAAAQVQVVNVTQRGAPPTGPSPIVVEHDQRLATHTIYRPATLGPSKHSVLVWGEGGCAKNGLTFPEFLSEIASYGFVVVADGPPSSKPREDKRAPVAARRLRARRDREEGRRRRKTRRVADRVAGPLPPAEREAEHRQPSMPTARL